MGQIDSNLIKLDGAYNVRELGGYKTIDGRKTRKGVFVRSDGTGNLSLKDIEILKGMGLKLVIDLRSKDELNMYPSKLENIEYVEYKNVVMFDGIHSSILKGAFPSSMGKMYVSLLNSCKDKYAYIFKKFANIDGLTLFNCTAGKDRTGVLAMLLLNLVNVSDETIIDDYAVSEHNMKVADEKQKQSIKLRGIKVPNYIFQSNPKNMEYTLNHFKSHYRNSQNYLLECGVTLKEIEIIKNRFLE